VRRPGGHAACRVEGTHPLGGWTHSYGPTALAASAALAPVLPAPAAHKRVEEGLRTGGNRCAADSVCSVAAALMTAMFGAEAGLGMDAGMTPAQDDACGLTTFTVRFASHTEKDLQLSFQPMEQAARLIDEIRMRKAVPAFKQVRLVCSGRELSPEDPLRLAVTSGVLLCMISDVPPPPMTQLLAQEPPQANRLQRFIEWLDAVDPTVVLVWAFGIILAIAWLTLLVLYSTHAINNSITVLYRLTIVLVILCGISYSLFSEQGRRNRRSPVGVQVDAAQIQGIIPPRPRAQIGPGQVLHSSVYHRQPVHEPILQQ